MQPQFDAVLTDRRAPERREQPVQRRDRAPADQCQRCAQRPVQTLEQRDQTVPDDDRVGMLGELEKRAVDVEEQ
jgi:hypothetical protein